MSRHIALILTGGPQAAADHAPLLQAARQLGLTPQILDPGAGAPNPLTAGYAAGQIASALKATRPAIVHCVGLRASIVGCAACVMAGIGRRIFAIGAPDPLPGGRGVAGRTLRRWTGFALGRALRGGRTRYLFATEEEARLLGFAPADPAVAMAVLYGPDAERLRPLVMPPGPPLRVAVPTSFEGAAGIDTAVEALRLARESGVAVELSLPRRGTARSRAIPAARLRTWSAHPGIVWHDEAGDPAALWATRHLACFPSVSSEGVPPGLLAAGACGRPAVASDGPGHRAVVSDGQEGFLVAPADPAAMAAAFRRLAEDPVLLPRMGAAARARILHGWTERDAERRARALYEDLLAEPDQP